MGALGRGRGPNAGRGGKHLCLAHGDRILGLLGGGRPADPRDLCKPKLVEKDRLLFAGRNQVGLSDQCCSWDPR